QLPEPRGTQRTRRFTGYRSKDRMRFFLSLSVLRAPNKMTGPALLPSFSRVSRGFEDHVSEPANAQLDAASWAGRGGSEAEVGVTWVRLPPPPPPACAGTPPRAGGEFILLGALSD